MVFTSIAAADPATPPPLAAAKPAAMAMMLSRAIACTAMVPELAVMLVLAPALPVTSAAVVPVSIGSASAGAAEAAPDPAAPRPSASSRYVRPAATATSAPEVMTAPGSTWAIVVMSSTATVPAMVTATAPEPAPAAPAFCNELVLTATTTTPRCPATIGAPKGLLKSADPSKALDETMGTPASASRSSVCPSVACVSPALTAMAFPAAASAAVAASSRWFASTTMT